MGNHTASSKHHPASSKHHDKPVSLRVRCVESIAAVDRAAWDALDHGPSPFLSYGFLRALELSKSIGGRSGWHPVYVLAETDSDESPSLVGAVTAFVKGHSYGEYIFDWSWAGAAERAGIPYYPKLVVAAPHTPATGKRLLILPGADVELVSHALVAGVKEVADVTESSSIHWLFCTAEEQARLETMGFAGRATFQFHWHNQGYASYDDFLGKLTSRKRKQLRKERRRALEHLDGPVRFIAGRDLTDEHLDAMDRYYRSTVYAHGGMDYLRPRFFHLLAEHAPDQMLFAEARRSGKLIAGAFFMETAQGLYGRYWGCDEGVDFLHFETAYYAGIERCIEKKIPLFEAGAQGEHKLLRGFMPSFTYSAHWMRHQGLHSAICDSLRHENPSVALRMERMAEHSPFRQEGGSGSEGEIEDEAP